jgi:hypothetical protein
MKSGPHETRPNERRPLHFDVLPGFTRDRHRHTTRSMGNRFSRAAACPRVARDRSRTRRSLLQSSQLFARVPFRRGQLRTAPPFHPTCNPRQTELGMRASGVVVPELDSAARADPKARAASVIVGRLIEIGIPAHGTDVLGTIGH